MDLFDSHCHIDVSAFDTDRNQVLQRAREHGVKRLLVPAVDAAHWEQLIALCGQDAGLYPALGLHPVYVDNHSRQDINSLESAVAEHKPVAVGEIGLDYFVTGLDRDKQQVLFEAQLVVARDAGLPVVLHVRKAHDQVLATLRRIRVHGGVAHAFNGSTQQAQQYIDLGFKLGFGGTLTYERSSKIHALARQLPVTSLVLETDAPDMVVAAHRGERNSPEYLPDCLQALADIRDEAPGDLASQTTANACAAFGLQETTC